MNCNREWLSLYLDRELALPNVVKLEGHLQRCVECQSELAQLRRMDTLLISTGALRSPLSPQTNRRILNSVERKRRPRWIGRQAASALMGTVLAALLLVSGMNVTLPFAGSNAPTAESPQVQRLLAEQTGPLQDASRVSAITGGRSTTPPEALPVGRARQFVN